MTLRHSAALTLVGWYLMIIANPPSRVWGWWYQITDEARPLSDWEIVQSFDSATDCRQVRQQFQQLAIILRKNNPAHGEKQLVSDEDASSAMQAMYDQLSPNVDVIDDLTERLLLMKHSTRWAYDPKEEALSTRLMSVQCIGTDDPRLRP
jgi:hypothetical protein